MVVGNGNDDTAGNDRGAADQDPVGVEHFRAVDRAVALVGRPRLHVWQAYATMGGELTFPQLCAALDRRSGLSLREYDRLAAAVNDELIDIGQPVRLPYLTPARLPPGFVEPAGQSADGAPPPGSERDS